MPNMTVPIRIPASLMACGILYQISVFNLSNWHNFSIDFTDKKANDCISIFALLVAGFG